MEIIEQASLAPLTTLGVGGTARYLVRATAAADIAAAVAFSEQKTGQSPIILGDGTNVLFPDESLDRVVLQVALPGITESVQANGTVELTVGAGEDWDAVVAYAVERGFSGLENLSGIPGTVGAAPVQNINAYGASVADSIVSVEVYDTAAGAACRLTAAECHFGYRDSIFKHGDGRNLIITAVTFCLVKEQKSALDYQSSSQSIARLIAERGVEPSPETVRDAVLTARGNIGMLKGQYRSAGSFFKNTILPEEQFAKLQAVISEEHAERSEKLSPWYWPLPDGRVKVSTAFLLECTPYNKTTYGTTRIDGVGFSPKHSLSIVTEPGATAAQVRAFASRVETAVSETLGVQIEPEVIFIEQ